MEEREGDRLGSQDRLELEERMTKIKRHHEIRN